MSTNRESPATSQAPATKGRHLLTIDAERSRIGFRVRKMGLYFVKGRFRRVSGWLELDAAGAPIAGEAEIETASISTRMPPRDWHLRGRDFLDARHHPTIRVVVDDVRSSDHELLADAAMTIHGRSGQVRLRGHGHDDDRAVVLHMSGTLDRRAFGIRARRPFEWIVGTEVRLEALLVYQWQGWDALRS